MAQQYLDHEIDPGFSLPDGFRADDFLNCAHGEAALLALLSGDYTELDAMPEPVDDGRVVA